MLAMEWAKYVSVVLASAIKFVGGPITGFALGLVWWQTVLLTVAGMMLTVVVVSVGGRQVQRWWNQHNPQKVAKRFSKRTRLAVRIWSRFGVWGIACLTPVLFTPIGGTLLALSFRVSFARLVVPMLLFGVLWGVVFTLLMYQLEAVRTFFV
jgi:Na+/pantothenate symporter